MRVVHVYKDHDPVPGGIEHTIRDLARAQATAGLDVAVLVTDPGGQPRREVVHGVRILRVPRFATLASTPLPHGMGRALAALAPDLVHVHMPYPPGSVTAWWHRHRAPYVITYHCDIVRQQRLLIAYRPLLRRILRDAAAVMPTSQRYAETSAVLADAAVPLTPVPLGIDPAPLRAAAAAAAAEHDVAAASDSGRTVLFAGVHRHYKGVDVLLRAMTQLPAEIRLIVAGDGPLRTAWQDLAVALELEGRVDFVGRVDDAALHRLYASADAVVLPSTSRAEAFGLVLLEAMAAGVPAVTTEVGSATSEVVVDGVTGAVTRPGDPDALADAIARVLGAAHGAMAAAAAARAAAFTIEAMRGRVDAVYASVLAGS